MLGRQLQRSTFVIDQAGANRVTYHSDIAPQNNQVLDSTYGQSVAGQVPVNVYKPYYPKIETVQERKITPQDVFKAQNKEVQKIVTAANIQGINNPAPGQFPGVGRNGGSSGNGAPPTPPTSEDVFFDPSEFFDAESGTVSTRGTTVDSVSTISIDEMVAQWDAMLSPVQSVFESIDVTSTDNRIEEEITDDGQVPVENPESQLPAPILPLPRGLNPNVSSTGFQRGNRPPMIQTGGLFQPNFAPRPRPTTPVVPRSVRPLIEGIPIVALRDERVVTAVNDFIEKEPSINKKILNNNIDAKRAIEDLSESSTHLSDDVISETLAKLMVKQGRNEKAIDIYKKLIWKFPQKKSYFADQIKKLKTE